MKILVALLLYFIVNNAWAELMEIQVHPSQRFLMYENGDPFFPLADTQWELTHRATREKALRILDNRQQKGFNAINLALAFHWANAEPNAYGAIAGTPGNWNIDYWSHVDFIVDAIIERGMHPIIFPVWGNLLGGEDNIFTPASAEKFGQWIARRYQNRPGIFYVLGGDRIPNKAIIAATARGLKSVSPQRLISFHPHNRKSSSLYFHDQPWLDLNMIQTGHENAEQPESYSEITRLLAADYARHPPKPVIDIEPRYEAYYPLDQPPPFTPYDVRLAAYWSVFSGSAGIGYGHNQIWSWGYYGGGEKRVWESLDSPASFQMRYLRELMLSRPFFSRRPDQSLIASDSTGIAATRGKGYAMIFLHRGQAVTVNLEKISGQQLKAWWYNPRTGNACDAGTLKNQGRATFKLDSAVESQKSTQALGTTGKTEKKLITNKVTMLFSDLSGTPITCASFPRLTAESGSKPPEHDNAPLDWVLVLDDASRKYPAPGQSMVELTKQETGQY